MSVSHTQQSGKVHSELTRRGNQHLADIRTSNDLSNTHLSSVSTNTTTAATKLTNIQTITDTKLSAIQTFLDKDSGTNFHNAQIHTKLDQANTHHTTAHGHQTTAHGKQDTIIAHHLTAHAKLDTINTTNTSNNSALVSIRDVNLPQIHNDLVGVSGFTSGSNTALVNIRDTNLPQIHNDIVRVETNQTDGTQLTKVMGSQDGTTSGTQKQLAVNSSGQIIVEQAPFTIVSTTTLGNTNRLDNSNSSGLSDTIDMNGFNNLSFSVKYTADSGQDFSDPLKYVYIFASYDNSEFFNTGSSVQLAEHGISGASGTYRGFAFVGTFGARYLKLGANVAGTNFSACEVKFMRFNQGM